MFFPDPNTLNLPEAKSKGETLLTDGRNLLAPERVRQGASKSVIRGHVRQQRTQRAYEIFDTRVVENSCSSHQSQQFAGGMEASTCLEGRTPVVLFSIDWLVTSAVSCVERVSLEKTIDYH
jgi:hypothetical protein